MHIPNKTELCPRCYSTHFKCTPPSEWAWV